MDSYTPRVSRAGAASFKMFGAMAGVGLVLLLILGLILVGFPRAVDAGEVCVITRGGKTTGEEQSGYTWINFMEDANCMSIRPINYAAVIPGDDSKVEYTAVAPVARSSDQTIDHAPYLLSFYIPAELPAYNMETLQPIMDQQEDGTEVPRIARRNNVTWVYTNIGRTEDSVVRKVLDAQQYIVPQVLQTYSSEQLFAGNLQEPQAEIFRRMFPVFYNHGVLLTSVQLGKPDFNDQYEEVIRAEQIAAQNVEIERQNTLKVEELNKQQLMKAQADADAEVIRAQGDADADIILREAEAEGNQKIVDSYGGPEYYIQALWARAAGSWNMNTVVGGDSNALPLINIPISEEADGSVSVPPSDLEQSPDLEESVPAN